MSQSEEPWMDWHLNDTTVGYRLGPPKFCERCGKELVVSTINDSRYDKYTGESIPRYRQLYQCPDYAPSVGHTFEYYEGHTVWVTYDT